MKKIILHLIESIHSRWNNSQLATIKVFSKSSKSNYLFPLLLVLLASACSENKEHKVLVFEDQNDKFVAHNEDYAINLKNNTVEIEIGTTQVNMKIEANTPIREGDQVIYKGLANKADLVFYDKGSGNAGYDIHLQPRGNLEEVKISLEGAKNAYLTGSGQLAIPVEGGEIRHSKPYAYQEIEGERIEVDSRFALAEGILSFEVGAYNPNYELVIDPEISFVPSEMMFITLGGVDLGDLTDYIFFFADANGGANWQGATKGFIGDVAIDGIQADESTSGSVPYAGTIYTNDATLDAWQGIVDDNATPNVSPTQAFGVTGQTTLISGLEADLIGAIQTINGLPVTSGFNGVSSTSLNGLNIQNGMDETYVININSDLSVSSQINITGDAGDIFIFRWDDDNNIANGYDGNIKFQSGGAFVPNGDLKATNFIHVAGVLESSGGGSNPPPPFPQGPRTNDGTGTLIEDGADFSGGGFFTGYWLTTGAPTTQLGTTGIFIGDNGTLSNGIFVGAWYSLNTAFSMTSGTSGVYVSPPVPPCAAVASTLSKS